MGKLRNFDKINWKPFKKRVNNVGVRNFWIDDEGIPQPLQSHLTDTFNYFEIVKYYPNSYYGKESEYEFDEDRNLYKGKYFNTFINKSCFKNPESCFTLASWVDIDHDEKTPDLKFVGKRPLELDEDELKDFLICAKEGQDFIEKILEDFEEDEI